jgi:hypothetical protein
MPVLPVKFVQTNDDAAKMSFELETEKAEPEVAAKQFVMFMRESVALVEPTAWVKSVPSPVTAHPDTTDMSEKLQVLFAQADTKANEPSSPAWQEFTHRETNVAAGEAM